MRPVFSFLLALSLIGSTLLNCAYAAAGGSPGWQDEAVDLLSKYLQIDTTNPPGNEKLGAEYLAGILRRNGLEAQILEAAPNRACVYARLKGTGAQRAVVLLNHIDVVPAKAEDWKVPPFSGKVVDGEIWGRGALDMKGTAIAQLEAMLMLKRSGKKLKRDIIFLGTPDEEVGGREGAEWFVKNHADLVKDAEFLFNEGFFIEADAQGKPRYWGVDIAEKSVLWLKLTAKGDAGHGSMPIPDSATNKLVVALNKLVTSPPDTSVLPPVREFFKSISGIESAPLLRTAYFDIDAAVKKPEVLNVLLSDKLKAAMLRNTTSLTVLEAGYKTNVIPAEASAQLDCRLLPGVNKDEFIQRVSAKIADPSISISVLDWVYAQASPYNTAAYKAIAEVANETMPGVPVVPVIVPWFTDSHWFRDLGIVAYGFEPIRIDMEHLATMHGKNERVPVKNYLEGIELTHKILEKLCVE